MKPAFFLFTLCVLNFVSGPAFAGPVTCSKVDPNQKFSDGIPMCPDSIRTNSIASVLRCVYDQAKTLKVVTAADTRNLAALFDDIQSHVDRSRDLQNFAINPVALNASAILSHADAVGLQACRSVDLARNDSFLLFYTKPGIFDNTGAFFGIREVKTSRIVVLLPHDDSDGYFVSGKEAFSRSSAFGFMSNANRRSRFGGRANDWSHEARNWGFKFFQNFNRMSVNSDRNKPFMMNMHGQADLSTFLSYAGPNRPLSLAAYNTAVSEVLPGLQRKAFTVYYVIRFQVPDSSDRYIQSELPAARHMNGRPILGVVTRLEMDSLTSPGVPRFPFIWSRPGETN